MTFAETDKKIGDFKRALVAPATGISPPSESTRHVHCMSLCVGFPYLGNVTAWQFRTVIELGAHHVMPGLTRRERHHDQPDESSDAGVLVSFPGA